MTEKKPIRVRSEMIRHKGKIYTATIYYNIPIPNELEIRAVTWGKTIFVKGDYLDKRLLEHELEHVRQFLQYGTRGFFRRYMKSYWKNLQRNLQKLEGWTVTKLWKAHKDAYRQITLEREARKKAIEVGKAATLGES